MTTHVRATVQCDACHASITYEGPSGVSLKDAIEIAHDRYGWTVSGRNARCFEDRRRPIAFHTYEPDAKSPYARCVNCKAYDSATSPHHPQHNETAVRRQAAKLARERFATWGRR